MLKIILVELKAQIPFWNLLTFIDVDPWYTNKQLRNLGDKNGDGFVNSKGE